MLRQHMANQCTKFKGSSFSRSGDILGESKKLNGSRDHNHAPFGGDLLFVCQFIESILNTNCDL